MRNRLQDIPIVIIFLCLPLMGRTPDHLIPVITQCTRLHVEPNINSEFIRTLDITTLINVPPKDRIKPGVVNGIKGNWLQINFSCNDIKCIDERCEETECIDYESGWIFDINLGYPRNFKKIFKWKPVTFEDCVGDYCPKIEIKSNGFYKYSIHACVDGNCGENRNEYPCSREQEKREVLPYGVKCSGWGRLFKFRNIINLRHFNQVTNEFLYVKEDGSLIFPYLAQEKCQ